MIVVRIFAGLGNQMFSYALGKRIADVTGRELVIDATEYALIPGRTYGLDYFRGPSATAKTELFSSCIFIAARLFQRFGLKKCKALLRFFGYMMHYGDGAESFRLAFDNILQRRNGRDYIYGCLIRLLYKPSRSDLRHEFSLVSPPNARNAEWLSMISASGKASCSVHVRRSDFVNERIALDYSWYKAAIAEICRRVSSPRFFVFSDDIDWCRKTFSTVGEAVFVTSNELMPAEDLRLMEACHHHVVANSTFSWWGAYIGEPGGVTICPTSFYDGRVKAVPGVSVPDD